MSSARSTTEVKGEERTLKIDNHYYLATIESKPDRVLYKFSNNDIAQIVLVGIKQKLRNADANVVHSGLNNATAKNSQFTLTTEQDLLLLSLDGVVVEDSNVQRVLNNHIRKITHHNAQNYVRNVENEIKLQAAFLASLGQQNYIDDDTQTQSAILASLASVESKNAATTSATEIKHSVTTVNRQEFRPFTGQFFKLGDSLLKTASIKVLDSKSRTPEAKQKDPKFSGNSFTIS